MFIFTSYKRVESVRGTRKAEEGVIVLYRKRVDLVAKCAKLNPKNLPVRDGFKPLATELEEWEAGLKSLGLVLQPQHRQRGTAERRMGFPGFCRTDLQPNHPFSMTPSWRVF